MPAEAADAHRLRIHLLGTFAVVIDGRRVEDAAWRLRKARSVVKLLALASGHRLHREQVLDQLWPDLDREAAANNLRQTLHHARRTLGSASGPHGGVEWIVSRDQMLVLDPVPWVDVAAFEQAAESGQGGRDVEAHERAVGTYAGDLLPDDRYEQWTLERREALRRRYLALLVALGRLYEDRGDITCASVALQRVVDADPAHELAHITLMRLYASSGQRHQAVQQFRLLEVGLKRELDVSPGMEARRLYEDILAGRYSDTITPSPALAPPPAQPPEPAQRAPGPRREPNARAWSAALPVAPTSFVGRDQELRDLRALFTRERLITLLGPAGFGKTRLALEFARGTGASEGGDMWYVDLAALHDPALVPPAVATAIGLREQPVDPLVSVSERIQDRAALLILDNCEHLLTGCAALADRLLRFCPNVRILATSRGRLGVAGEALYPVPSLSVPAERTPVDDVLRFDAIRLFVERARSVRPGFELTPHNAATIAELCRKLDGMPLAIELAAARTLHLSVDQIVERLDDRFHLLHGPRLGVSRHRSLETAIAWSYGLLADGERTLFDRLAAFAGGFTLDAAEAVCAGDGLERSEILGLLSDLIDKSLVTVEEDRFGRVRYRLLETLRAYGRDRLRETGTSDAAHARLCAYVIAMAERGGSELSPPERTRWIERLEAEHDNLRAAIGWSMEHDAPAAARLAAALGSYWRARHPTEGREWLARVLALGPGIPESRRLAALLWATELTMFQDDYDPASVLGEEAVGLAERLEDQASLALALACLGHTLWHRRDAARGVALCHQALELTGSVRDQGTLRLLMHHCARVAWHEGDYGQVTALAGQLLALSREASDTANEIEALALLGEAARSRRAYAAAAGLFQDALARARKVGDQFRAATLQPRLGDVLRILGDSASARVLYLDSVASLSRLGEKWFLMRSLVGLARLTVDASPAGAARLLGAAQNLRDALGALPDQANFDRAVTAVRNVAADGFDAAWAEGRVMPLDDVVRSLLP